MPNVIISADSTCDLSPEQRERHQVRSFPFHIEFRGRDHLDNIDITPQVLFDGFYEDKSLPQTGACSPEAYRQHFAELDGRRLARSIHFNLGSALSSAYENAKRSGGRHGGRLRHRRQEPLDRHRPTGARGLPHARRRHERRRHRPRGRRAAQPIPCLVCAGHHGVPRRRRPVPHAGGLPGRQAQLPAGHPRGQPERRHEGGQALPRQAGERCSSAT